MKTIMTALSLCLISFSASAENLETYIDSCIKDSNYVLTKYDMPGVIPFTKNIHYRSYVSCSGESAKALYDFLGNSVRDRVFKYEGKISYIQRALSQTSECHRNSEYPGSSTEYMCTFDISILKSIMKAHAVE